MAKFIIEVVAQSNRWGEGDYASMSAQYKQALPLIKTWNGTSFETLDYSVPNNQYPTSFPGCGTEFARCVALQNYFGETIYRITYAVGGTKLGTAGGATAATSWNTSLPGGVTYKAISAINSALAYAWNTLGIRTFDFYIFPGQGEGDSIIPADAAAWATNFTNIKTAFDTNFAGTALSISKKIWIILKTNTSIVSTGSPSAVIGATNATPIEITTGAAHQLATGSVLVISGVNGNTAANGTFTITVTAANKYTLNSSVGNGAYTSGGTCNRFSQVATVNTAQETFANGSTVFTVDSNGYATSDGVHFTTASYESLGLLEADIVINNNL